MTAYLIKFILCSGLLLLVYRLLLANESMYRFNRIYLLLSLAFSLTVPFVTRTVQVEVAPVATQPVVTQNFAEQPVMDYAAPVHEAAIQPVVPSHNYWPAVLFALYGLVTAFFLARFIINLYRISRSVAEAKVVSHHHHRVLLTDRKLTPHSFLSYIFINKDDYKDGQIEPEIICHEQAHVKQLHSVDILLIELLQSVCWFNPFIPFYRRAIQLNHEFLADEAVIRNYQDTPSYQYLLLAKASHTNSLQLTSQFNYQTTKKRLMMMTKATPATIAIMKQLALVPVLVGALLLFSQKVIAQSPAAPSLPVVTAIQKMPAAKKDAPQAIMNEYKAILKKYKEYYPTLTTMSYYINKSNITASDKARLLALFKQMSSTQQAKQEVKFYPRRSLRAKINPTIEDLKAWKNAGKYTVRINYKIVKNKDLDKYKPADFDLYSITPYAAFGIKKDRKEISLITRERYAVIYKAYKADTSKYTFGITVLPPLIFPFVVVDGVPFDQKAFNKPALYKFDFKTASNASYGRLLGIEPSDILTINVLKGEEGKAVWGPKGENGVVVITTKNAASQTAIEYKLPHTEIAKPIDKDHQPLIVVDGKPTDKQIPAGFNFGTAGNAEYAELLSLPANDFATISVLKGTAATAVWGQKAENGVLIITTKSGTRKSN